MKIIIAYVMDSTIQRINHYSPDNSTGWIILTYFRPHLSWAEVRNQH